MSASEILKTFHEVFNNGEVTVAVDERNLGMAYAVPLGLETTVVENFSPWQSGELRQNFFRESLLGGTMADIELIMTWQFSFAQQFIVNVFLNKVIRAMDPTVNVAIRVRFGQPALFDTALEAYEIPFNVDVVFDPLFGSNSTVYQGVVRADGFGSFSQL